MLELVFAPTTPNPEVATAEVETVTLEFLAFIKGDPGVDNLAYFDLRDAAGVLIQTFLTGVITP